MKAKKEVHSRIEDLNIDRINRSFFKGVFKRVLSSTINKSIKEVMTKKVKYGDPEMPLIRAAYFMVKEKISALVIKNENHVVGILSENDFLMRRFSEKELRNLKVKNVMTKRIFSINSDQPVIKAIGLMREKGIRKLPVIDKNELVGIITQTDVVKHMDNQLSNFVINKIDIKTVGDVMTKNVITVTRNYNFVKAIKIMGKKRLSCVIVVEKNVPIGVLTERDVLNEIVVNADILHRFEVGDVMTSSPIWIEPKHKVFSANSLMIKKGVRRLPVIENHQLLGIVTETDLAQAMYDLVAKIVKKL